jgi:hypothetical protein
MICHPTEFAQRMVIGGKAFLHEFVPLERGLNDAAIPRI